MRITNEMVERATKAIEEARHWFYRDAPNSVLARAALEAALNSK